MGPCRRKESLVTDDLVLVQANLMDRVAIVELIAFEPVRLAEIVPTLLLDENGVAKAIDPVHQLPVKADRRSRDDNEHRRTPRVG